MDTYEKKYNQLVLDALNFLKDKRCAMVFSSKKDVLFFEKDILATQAPLKQEVVFEKPKSSFLPLANPSSTPVKEFVSPLKKKVISQLPSKEQEEKNNDPYSRIALDPPKQEFSSSDNLKKLLFLIAPDIVYIEKIPDDEIAKQIAQAWKYKNQAKPISILSFNEKDFAKKFLKNLAKALDISFAKATVIEGTSIEKKDLWQSFLSDEKLKLIIVSTQALSQCENLKKQLKQNSLSQEKTLKDIPLFVIPDIDVYEKNFMKKKELWKRLEQKITSISL